MKNIRYFGLMLTLVFILLLPGCTLPQDAPTIAPPAVSQVGLRAWIDKPLNESTHPLAPLNLVLHGGDAVGIQSFELSVNGEVFFNDISSDEITLQTREVTWTPSEAGDYLFSLRVMNSAQLWSAPATALVNIEGQEPEEPSVDPTPTLAPTASPSPTLQSTITATPQPPGTVFSGITKSAELFYYRFSDCPGKTPNQITLTVLAADPAWIVNVELYYKAIHKTEGTSTEWSSQVMSNLGEGRFSAVIDADSVMTLGSGNQTWFTYQFVSSNSDGLISRSEVFSDVSLHGCQE